MRKITQLFLLLVLLIFISCKSEIDLSESKNSTTQSRSSANIEMPQAIPGQIVIKLNENSVIDKELFNKGIVPMNSVPSQMSTALKSINATEMKRLFPPAGKFEGRTRRSGMHLYMIVSFDENIEVSQAMKTMQSISGVENVEPVYKIQRSSVNQQPSPFLAQPFSLKRDDKAPFNDPLLPSQWHYDNKGKAPKSVIGADINLFKAWEITKGTPNVIVCVVDGGVDINHEDIKDNLWINEAELNGTPGVDDDGNGFIDDINGWCHVDNTNDIYADDHGSHVAGTIAAKNNNGIGVAGVAGGDGTPDSGIRIMSSGIFRGERGGNAANAIKYGADNGAVISQNSWGYGYPNTTLPSYIRVAIDYFIKYAGCDDDGNQLADSPMKGGVVVFAAGNDNREFLSQPAAYEPVVAVTAMSTNFSKASYTNRGDWADIMAPGGDQKRYGTKAGVLSLYKNNKYGYMQGTSMACPHVSGVCALIVSRFGSRGFTNEMLKEQLYASILPVNIDEENPGFEGKLGVGYVDAYAAVRNRNEGKAPNSPQILEDKSSETDFTSITLYWEVPSDADDEQASFYKLYFSTEKLTANNYEQKGTIIGSPNGYINGVGKVAGDEMYYELQGLDTDTKYYFAIVAYDRWKLASQPSFFETKTKKNNPPVIVNIPSEPIDVFYGSTNNAEYSLEVKDPEGHDWEYFIEGDTKGVSHKRTDNNINITIRPVLDVGEYKFTVKLVDKLSAETETEISFRILKFIPPVKLKNIDSQLLGINNGDKEINLNEYFKKLELFSNTYTAKANDGAIVKVNVNDNGILVLNAQKIGETTVTVIADNGHKDKTKIIFTAQVTEDINKSVYSVWPIPVVDKLNAWVNPKYKKATFIVTSAKGEEVINHTATVNSKNQASVNLINLAPGTYSLKIETSGEVFTKTIVKQ